MADVWGRLTGRAGVCLATLGPGATNLTTGPGRREPRPGARGGDHGPARPRPPPQGVPPVRRHRGGVPALHEVERPDRDGRGHPRGRAQGVQGRPGGEARRLPPRAAGGRGRGARRGRAPPRRPAAPPVARPAVARARRGHHQPGGPPADPRRQRRDPGTRLAGAARRWPSAPQIPVVTTFMAKGAIPADHPLLVTHRRPRLRRHRACRVHEARTSSSPWATTRSSTRPARWNPSGHARIVHVDFTAAEVDARYQPDVEVVADVREALELLAPLVAVRPQARPPAPRPRRSPAARATPSPCCPQRIMADLEAVLAPEDLVVSDVGAHKLWVAKAYGARLPNTVIISNGFAAMGIGLPGGDRRQAGRAGPAGGHRHRRRRLPHERRRSSRRRAGWASRFVVLILRDDGYGVIRWKQQKRFGRTAGVDLGNPDLVALAEAFGCRGIRVESAAGLRPALDAALASAGAGARRLPGRLRRERPAGGAVGPMTAEQGRAASPGPAWPVAIPLPARSRGRHPALSAMAFRLPRDARLVRFPSGDGLQLEGRLTAGGRDRGVVLCHPHPLYGGSMLTPVILTVETAFREAGFTTLAFNFRGVGASEGTHGEGRTEVADVAGALAHLRAALDGAPRTGRRRGLLVRQPRRRPGRRGRSGRRLLPGRRARRPALRLRLPGRPPRPRRAHRRVPRRVLRPGAPRGARGEPAGAALAPRARHGPLLRGRAGRPRGGVRRGHRLGGRANTGTGAHPP